MAGLVSASLVSGSVAAEMILRELLLGDSLTVSRVLPAVKGIVGREGPLVADRQD
jgi:hypothetical protein